MRAREFDIKLIDADIEEFKNLLDVFRDVFDWGDHDHPDEEYLLRLLKDELTQIGRASCRERV